MNTSDDGRKARRWGDVDPARSRIMSQIRGKNTAPERTVRTLLHNMGYRYRLHASDLPGKPDIVFRSRRKVIFIHGCYWHGHKDPNCRLARVPKTRVDFWKAKIDRNWQRDIVTEKKLNVAGWEVLVLWECQLRNTNFVTSNLRKFLDERSARA